MDVSSQKISKRYAMKIWSTVLILFLFASLKGQSNDSLWHNFNNEELSDSLRLVSLHKLARSYLYNNPDSSLMLSGLENEYALTVNDTFWIAASLNLMGVALVVKSDFPGGLDKLIRSLEFRVALRDTAAIAEAYNNIGNIFYYQGDYPGALEHFLRSSEYDEMKGNQKGMAISLLNIGSIYAEQKQYQEALNYFKQSTQLLDSLNSPKILGSCYVNIASIYKSLDSLDLAREYFEKGIQLMIETGDDMSLGIAYDNLAKLYLQAGDYDSMIAYYLESQKISEKIGDRNGLAALRVARGTAYHLMGRNHLAYNECLSGLNLAESLGSLPIVRDACDCLYKASRARGQNEVALIYYERFNQLNDSLSIAETQKKLQLMEFRKQVAEDSIRRVEEKLATILAHEQAIRKENIRRNLLLAAGLLLLVLSVILYRNFRQVSRRNRLIADAKKRSDQLLLKILPAGAARELLEKGRVEAREFEHVTVLFTDFIGFAGTSQEMSHQELIKELDQYFHAFDEIISSYDLVRIKTIGDSYMAAGGLPLYTPETIEKTVLAAIEMQEYIAQYGRKREAQGKQGFHMRVGLHHGPVIAGIIGKQSYQYDIWGDTVNVASRLESAGTGGRVNISRAVYDQIKDNPLFQSEPRGTIDVKGKGDMEMWFVEKRENL
jgi:adenylate cyclase